MLHCFCVGIPPAAGCLGDLTVVNFVAAPQ